MLSKPAIVARLVVVWYLLLLSEKWLAPCDSAVLAGALAGLQRRWPPGSGRTGAQWVDARVPFGAFTYSTYTEGSYEAIWANYSYISPNTEWFRRDFGKPNCSSAHPRRADTLAQARRVWLQQVSASHCCVLLICQLMQRSFLVLVLLHCATLARVAVTTFSFMGQLTTHMRYAFTVCLTFSVCHAAVPARQLPRPGAREVAAGACAQRGRAGRGLAGHRIAGGGQPPAVRRVVGQQDRHAPA